MVDDVVGLDRDEESVANARSYGPTDGVQYIVGDFLIFGFERASFDLITSVAASHHMDEEAALRRMPELMRLSDTLALVGLRRSPFASRCCMGACPSRHDTSSQPDKVVLGDAGAYGLTPPRSYDELRHMSVLCPTGQALPETGNVALCHYVDQAGHWATLTPSRIPVMGWASLSEVRAPGRAERRLGTRP